MRVVALTLMLFGLSGCMSSPPEQPENICEIFYEKDSWYKDAKKASHRWGSSIPVMMAFIHQESAFRAKARPPRTKILWVIPGPRPASAYGYSQATDDTWDIYKRATGSWGADRNDFDDAIDFIGWYNDQSHRRNGIARTDAYSLYLAYHEGHGGFGKRSFAKKQWLKDVSSKVSRRAVVYGEQLKGCEKKLNRGFFGRLFS
jgi:hypothetical protein